MRASNLVRFVASTESQAHYSWCFEGVLSGKGQQLPGSFKVQEKCLLAALKAYAKEGNLIDGRRLHADILKSGFLEKSIYIGSAVIDLYSKCGALVHAQQVFDELPARNVAAWTALIAGYAKHGRFEESLHFFEQMQVEGFAPDAVAFACILKVCGTIRALKKGEEIHNCIIRLGLLQEDVWLGNSLLDMYAKCGAISKAAMVFNELPVRDVITWTALITCYVQHGYGEEALVCFEQMQNAGFSPNAVTFACAVKACTSIKAAEKGKEVHAQIINERLLQKHSLFGTGLIDMYARYGMLVQAKQVFDELPGRDVVSWNALISGYAKYGYVAEVLELYERMCHDSCPPNVMTFAYIVKACGSIGAVEKGKNIHAEIVKEGLLEKDDLIGIALVDMYARCGTLVQAEQVFDELSSPNLRCCNALMAGYAQIGDITSVFNLFNKMLRKCIEPDLASFTVVLNACSHSGLLDEGQTYFIVMNMPHGAVPTSEHHICMVDLFSRAGLFDKALAAIRKIPLVDQIAAWTALLGGCCTWGNVQLGRLAFHHAMRLDGKFDSAYVCMSNMYVAAGMHDEANVIDVLRGKKWLLHFYN